MKLTLHTAKRILIICPFCFAIVVLLTNQSVERILVLEQRNGRTQVKAAPFASDHDNYRENVVVGSTRQQPWRFCTNHRVEAQSFRLRIRYHCEGPKYDDFSRELLSLIESEATHHSEQWGRRGLPANSTLLVVGNSHLQQITENLLCQEAVHGSGIVDMYNLDTIEGHRSVRQYVFGNGAVIYHAVNTYSLHLEDWIEELEKQLGRTFDSFDMVVTGPINYCYSNVATTFANETQALLNERFGVPCQRNNGPTIEEFMDAFPSKPLLYVSMFALYASEDCLRAKKVITERNWSQTQYLDAREYIDTMGFGFECASRSSKSEGDCDNSIRAGLKYHRCTGYQGSHPDLVAWDMVEAFHQYLSK